MHSSRDFNFSKDLYKGGSTVRFWRDVLRLRNKNSWEAYFFLSRGWCSFDKDKLSQFKQTKRACLQYRRPENNNTSWNASSKPWVALPVQEAVVNAGLKAGPVQDQSIEDVGENVHKGVHEMEQPHWERDHKHVDQWQDAVAAVQMELVRSQVSLGADAGSQQGPEGDGDKERSHRAGVEQNPVGSVIPLQFPVTVLYSLVIWKLISC